MGSKAVGGSVPQRLDRQTLRGFWLLGEGCPYGVDFAAGLRGKWALKLCLKKNMTLGD